MRRNNSIIAVARNTATARFVVMRRELEMLREGSFIMRNPENLSRIPGKNKYLESLRRSNSFKLLGMLNLICGDAQAKQ